MTIFHDSSSARLKSKQAITFPKYSTLDLATSWNSDGLKWSFYHLIKTKSTQTNKQYDNKSVAKRHTCGFNWRVKTLNIPRFLVVKKRIFLHFNILNYFLLVPNKIRWCSRMWRSSRAWIIIRVCVLLKAKWKQTEQRVCFCLCECVSGRHARPPELCAYSQHPEQTSSDQRECGEFTVRVAFLSNCVLVWICFPIWILVRPNHIICLPVVFPSDPCEGTFWLRSIRWPLCPMQRTGLVLPEGRHPTHYQPVRPQLVAGVQGRRWG